MKNANTPANTAPMTARAFKIASYDAYVQYVKLIEGEISTETAVEAMAPLFANYGFTLTTDNILNVLTIRMTNYTTKDGEKVRNVKSIGVFRNFIKSGWREAEAAPVTSKRGKDPHTVAAPRKKSGMTKADLEAKIAELTAMLTAAQANQDTTTEETAA